MLSVGAFCGKCTESQKESGEVTRQSVGEYKGVVHQKLASSQSARIMLLKLDHRKRGGDHIRGTHAYT